MQPDEVPAELIHLYTTLRRNEINPAKALARILSKYDEQYTKRMQAFWQVWDAGWTPYADMIPRHEEVKKIRATIDGIPGYVTYHNSVKDAALYYRRNWRVVTAILSGEREVDIYEPKFRWVEE